MRQKGWKRENRIYHLLQLSPSLYLAQFSHLSSSAISLSGVRPYPLPRRTWLQADAITLFPRQLTPEPRKLAVPISKTNGKSSTY
ncbi:hypothetical protein J6590_015445 [Homalodisca vitripennis]|nr:hypothetical protein J6590_015445 [Homalodisca vitripennis]